MQDITKQAVDAFKAAIVLAEQAKRANQHVHRLVGRIPAEDRRLTEGFR